MQDTKQLNLNIIPEQFAATTELLQDHIILVTGASSGIGRALAKILAQNGATCILLARNVKNLESVYDEIVNAKHPMPAIYPFNLTTAKPEDYNDLRRNIDKNFGKLDGVMHLAGQLGALTPIEYYPLEQWFNIIQTNLNAQFMLTQAIIPLLKRAKAATTIFTINEIAKEPKAFWGAYAVANAGVVALADTLQQEYANYHNLNFHKVYLDKVKTPLYTKVYPSADPESLIAPQEAALEYLRLYTQNP